MVLDDCVYSSVPKLAGAPGLEKHEINRRVGIAPANVPLDVFRITVKYKY